MTYISAVDEPLWCRGLPKCHNLPKCRSLSPFIRSLFEAGFNGPRTRRELYPGIFNPELPALPSELLCFGQTKTLKADAKTTQSSFLSPIYDNSCTKFHLRVCFESMKSKSCQRNDYKFFHISGTTMRVQDQVPQKKAGNFQFQTSNRFSPLNDTASQEEPKEFYYFSNFWTKLGPIPVELIFKHILCHKNYKLWLF